MKEIIINSCLINNVDEKEWILDIKNATSFVKDRSFGSCFQ